MFGKDAGFFRYNCFIGRVDFFPRRWDKGQTAMRFELASCHVDVRKTGLIIERLLGGGINNDAPLVEPPLRLHMSGAQRDRLGNFPRMTSEERMQINLIERQPVEILYDER